MFDAMLCTFSYQMSVLSSGLASWISKELGKTNDLHFQPSASLRMGIRPNLHRYTDPISKAVGSLYFRDEIDLS